MSERCSRYISTDFLFGLTKEDWERIRITFLLWFHSKFISLPNHPMGHLWSHPIFETLVESNSFHSTLQSTYLCNGRWDPQRHLLCARPCVSIRAWRWSQPWSLPGGLQSLGKADHSKFCVEWWAVESITLTRNHTYHEKLKIWVEGVLWWSVVVLRVFSVLWVPIVGQGTKISTSS